VSNSQRERTRRAYDLVASAYAAALPDTRAEADIDLAMIDLFVNRLPGKAVLDAGCGTGRMMAYLVTRNSALELIGVDQSAAMLDQARAAGAERTVVQGDLADLPFDQSRFDGILAWYSVIHTPPNELRGVFVEFRRVLRDGGVVLVGFQAGAGERAITRAYGEEIDLTAYLYSPDDIRLALEECGFAVTVVAERAPISEKHSQAFLVAVATKG
jgi:ubiquinone/menaquinone biosynthesis C-methylase UbiE